MYKNLSQLFFTFAQLNPFELQSSDFEDKQYSIEQGSKFFRQKF